MRCQGLPATFLGFLLTVSVASAREYRIVGEFTSPGLNNLIVSAARDGVVAFRSGFEVYLQAGGPRLHINQINNSTSINIQEWGGSFGSVKSRPFGSSSSLSGYVGLDGKITSFEGANLNTFKAGGDWVGGEIEVNLSTVQKLGFAYNVKTGQRLEPAFDYGTVLAGASPTGTLVFQSRDEFAGSIGLNHRVHIWQNGVYSTVSGYNGFVHGINKHDEILLTNGGSVFIVQPGKPTREFNGQMAPDQPNFTQFSDLGTILMDSIFGFFVGDAKGWYDLRAITPGIPAGSKIWSAVQDPVTDRIYASIELGQDGPIKPLILDPVPEPGTLAALGLGVAAVLRKKRRTIGGQLGSIGRD